MTVLALGTLVVAVAANLGSTTTVTTTVSQNTVTQVSLVTTTSSGGTVTSTQTNTVITQPVIGETTTTSTATTTVLSSASTVTTTTTTTTSNSTTVFSPPVQYWAATELNPAGTFESVNPFNAGVFTENIAGSLINMQISPANATSSSLGFYVTIGTLSQLNVISGHGLVITGTGFSTQLWFIGSYTWNPVSNGVEQSTAGIFGLGATTGATTINSASTFKDFSSLGGPIGNGACSSTGTYSITSLVSTCGVNGNTPVAVWVGITNPNSATITAQVTSLSLS